MQRKQGLAKSTLARKAAILAAFFGFLIARYQGKPRCPHPFPTAKRKQILAAIKAGEQSRNAIAREYGVSVGTVTNIAKQAGSGQSDPDEAGRVGWVPLRTVVDLVSEREVLGSGSLVGLLYLLASRRDMAD